MGRYSGRAIGAMPLVTMCVLSPSGAFTTALLWHALATAVGQLGAYIAQVGAGRGAWGRVIGCAAQLRWWLWLELGCG